MKYKDNIIRPLKRKHAFAEINGGVISPCPDRVPASFDKLKNLPVIETVVDTQMLTTQHRQEPDTNESNIPVSTISSA
jgi:hypothetical protein